VLDATHDYTDDWIDRIDDFEEEAREAVDDVVEDRYHYYDEGPRGPRRYYYDRPDGREEPPPADQGRRRMSPSSEAEEVRHLKEKIGSLTKQVDALLQQETKHNSAKYTAPKPAEEEDSHLREQTEPVIAPAEFPPQLAAQAGTPEQSQKTVEVRKKGKKGSDQKRK